MFEQSEDQQQPCVICGQDNEQMLMLQCVHDPCIDCAARHYVENQPPNSLTYTCPKCRTRTQLDRTSVSQLVKTYHATKKRNKFKTSTPQYSYEDNSRYRDVSSKQLNKNPSRQMINRYQKSSSNPRKYVEEQKNGEQLRDWQARPYGPTSNQPVYSKNTKNNNIQYPCEDHPQQQLTYYCFTCTKPICPQCAIHGSHKDHEVQTTRKAIKQIKQYLTQDKQKLQIESNQLNSSKQKNKKLLKDWIDDNRKQQQFIKKKFQQLKLLINQKQKQLLKYADINLQNNSQLLRVEANVAEKAIQMINLTKKNIDSTMKKQDLVVLQEYNKRSQQTSQIVQNIQKEKTKQREFRNKNPAQSLDIAKFEDDVDRLLNQINGTKLSSTISN